VLRCDESGRMSLPSSLASKLRLPVVAAPLFIISNPDLVIAQCQAGIVGSFPALNARPAEVLGEWLARIVDELAAYDGAHPNAPSAPFAVNQIVHKSNDRLDRDVALCVKYRVPIVITSLGARPELNDAIHSYGGIVLHDVISIEHAHKAIDKGADGLIAVAAGAGGHAGALSPFALLQEIRAWWDGPLALSGAIATGSAIFAAQAAGADLAYIGSSFIATREANATDAYKDALVAGAAGDIIYTNYFTGVNGNYLKASVRNAGLDPAAMPAADPSKMNFGSEAKPKAWKDIWGSGQGIGAIVDVPPAADLVARLAREYDAAVARSARAAAPFVRATAGIS
jgi:nitronate monooxygenase